MSKVLKAIFGLSLLGLVILQSFNNSFGQNVTAIIKIDPGQVSTASISGSFDKNEKLNFWFLKDFGGVGSLAGRVSDVSLKSIDGNPVETKRLQPGEYLASTRFQSWSYKVDLSPLKTQSAAAHTSWIAGDRGILMLDDILPQITAAAKATIELRLPEGWQVFSTAKSIARNKYEVNDTEKAVFIIGNGIRSQTIAGLSQTANLIVSGDWQFADQDATAMIKEIYSNYRTVFDGYAVANFQVVLMKFPGAASPGVWEGDTRGSTVTIVSSDMPFKTQALQRLHEQFRHEIFHLWIPNGVNLSGNYDWFYEGFALYASLKGGVMMNRIRFEDFLDTLSRAYTIDSFQNPHMSLLDASQKRWSGGNTTVYARGMITAFLCDLALLKDSKGKTDVTSILKEVFNRYRGQGPETDGNEAVLGIMSQNPVLAPIIQRYIKGNEAIDWAADVDAAGVKSEERNSVTTLKVMEKLNSRQKALLDKLGYNNWRKN